MKSINGDTLSIRRISDQRLFEIPRDVLSSEDQKYIIEIEEEQKLAPSRVKPYWSTDLDRSIKRLDGAFEFCIVLLRRNHPEDKFEKFLKNVVQQKEIKDRLRKAKVPLVVLVDGSSTFGKFGIPSDLIEMEKGWAGTEYASSPCYIIYDGEYNYLGIGTIGFSSTPENEDISLEFFSSFINKNLRYIDSLTN